MDLAGENEPITGSGIAPMLGLVARSLGTELDLLPLPSIRVLVVLSHGHAMTVRQLADVLSVRTRAMLAMIDSLESGGWIFTAVRARGVTERVGITASGRELVERMTARREHEIASILRRVPDGNRAQLAEAFTSFAVAAGEQPVSRPRKGIAP